LEVADSGPGIPPDKSHLLFKTFERLGVDEKRTIEGAGLGLSLSKQLITQLGGQIGHDDNPGGGSVFWLEIPLHGVSEKMPATMSASVSGPMPAQAPAAPPAADPTPAPLAGALHVLVVDDVAMNLDIVGSFLRAAGHIVTCVDSGSAAIAAVSGTRFDVVLMDVRMPEMDGLEATRHIRSLERAGAHVPIIALTAECFTDQIAECSRAGMDGHLGKPFDRETLLKTVVDAADAGKAHSSEGEPAFMMAAEPEVPFKLAIPSALPLFNTAFFQQTAAYLSRGTTASHIRTIADQGTTLLLGLAEPHALAASGATLADGAHTLAGCAGLFGFERLSTECRHFEKAARAGGTEAPALAHQLRQVLVDTLQAIERHRGVWDRPA